ncbi:MAG: hypothetical protein MJE68_07945, partial [Proteobacteria bacterium]|nr:hypothetical protein [Pseudomonadota bacterium]
IIGFSFHRGKHTLPYLSSAPTKSSPRRRPQPTRQKAGATDAGNDGTGCAPINYYTESARTCFCFNTPPKQRKKKHLCFGEHG